MQVYLLSTKLGKQNVARNFKDLGRNKRSPVKCFFGLIYSYYKKGTLDFKTRMAYVNDKLTFHYCFHKYQLGETGTAG